MQEVQISDRLALSPIEAASYAGVSRTTIYTWLNQGLLPSTKIGRSRRIPKASLDVLLLGEEWASV